MTTTVIRPYEPLYGSLKATQIWRLAMLALSVFVVYQGTTFHRGILNLYFVSHIGGIVMAVYYAIALLHGLGSRHETGFFTRTLSVVFHLAASLQFMIFVFYWALLAFDDFDRILTNKPKGDVAKEFLVALVHHLFFPLAIWFTILLERTKFTSGNIWAVVIFSAVYVFLNGYITLSTGIPVYDVVDWKGIASHIHLGLGLGLIFVGFFISKALSQKISSRLGFLKTKDN